MICLILLDLSVGSRFSCMDVSPPRFLFSFYHRAGRKKRKSRCLSLVRIFCVVMIRRERIEETIYRFDGLLLFVGRRCLRGLPCNTLVDPSILFLKPSKFHCVLSTNCISSCNFYSRSLPLFQFSVPETSTQAFAFVHFIV